MNATNQPDSSAPKQRALLIGINYASMPSSNESTSTASSGELKGSHIDVAQIKGLLMNLYHYSRDDIVTLIDDGLVPHLQPTRANILREIDNLVRNAKAGDRFFLHYSGHVEQRENKDKTEEDGMDELLVPMDARGIDTDDERLMIRDDDLRAHLVDRVPRGSKLTAIFDSCHSATLLDLEHSHCNRVYIPHVSKGQRRSYSLWNENVRKNAMISNRTVYQTKRVSASTVETRKSSIRYCEGQERVRTRHLSLKTTYDPGTTPMYPIKQCESPVSMFTCDGWCKPADGVDSMAQVLSLSSCEDSQIAWETRGKSMTTALVKILQENPHPFLKDLMLRIVHEVHKYYVKLHDEAKKYRKEHAAYWKRGGIEPRAPSNMDNFQDPQLSSLLPLNFNEARWNP
ncbi:hypothetical protein BDZ89DRAFT_1065775 [Hymenopellis radicata]|nr:hypothetical protein BDZ89DRAFT_1065775 [Hymenopellis radicata]